MTVLLGPSPEVAGRETALDVPLAQSVGGTLKLVLAHFAGSGADSYLAFCAKRMAMDSAGCSLAVMTSSWLVGFDARAVRDRRRPGGGVRLRDSRAW